ncbi:MAG: DoxX family protein [Hyphomicrobiaceae bacterium]
MEQRQVEPSSHPALSYTDGLAVKLQDTWLLIGRILIGWIYMQSGLRKLMDMPAFVATMPRRGLPDVLGYVAPPVEFIGGLALILGMGTRYAALLILVFTAVATFSSHAWWAKPAAQQSMHHTHFWKNVTMMGGLVVLFVTAGGRFSLDRWLARKS